MTRPSAWHRSGLIRAWADPSFYDPKGALSSLAEPSTNQRGRDPFEHVLPEGLGSFGGEDCTFETVQKGVSIGMGRVHPARRKSFTMPISVTKFGPRFGRTGSLDKVPELAGARGQGLPDDELCSEAGT